MKHKIHLNSVKVKDMSSYGQRKHPIKKNKRPYEKHSINRKKNTEMQSPYLRRMMYQGLVSLVIIACVLVISSVDYKIFNDAEKGLEYLVNHEFSLNNTFSVFNIKSGDATAIPVSSEGDITFVPPTTGEVLADLLDKNNTPAGYIYSVPDTKCYCACDGIVFYVDKTSVDNPYIRIRHDEGFDSIYMGIIAEVKAGDNVTAGQIIGTSIGDTMGFVLLKNSKYTDVTPYMNTSE